MLPPRIGGALCYAEVRLAGVQAAVAEMTLWRGMKDVKVTKEFAERGGTELGEWDASTSRRRVDATAGVYCLFSSLSSR